MKIYMDKNVYEAALDRIRFLFDHFDVVIVNFSGGKDSTVILNLALRVAREKHRLPLPVFFIDQEAEWDATIDYVKKVMYCPDIEPYWLQCELRILNAVSYDQRYLYCWKEGEEWLRKKDKIAIKENKFGVIDFFDFFPAFTRLYFPNKSVARLNGIRAEESPRRFMGMTAHPVKYGITWGKVENKDLDHYAFSPIYDWSLSDVWHAIAEHGWRYNKIYDYMYMYGVPLQNMRVSSLHHETALYALFFMQEIEPETYAKLAKRLQGVNTAKIIGRKDYFVTELPFMFKSWVEYRDYLLDKLIENEEDKKRFKKLFSMYDRRYLPLMGDESVKPLVNSIIANDFETTKFFNHVESIERKLYAKAKKEIERQNKIK